MWDEETGTDVHGVGIFTLPEMELPFGTMEEVMQEIRRVAGELVARGKFPVVLGGEHSITAPIVAAVAAKHKGLSVLQLDAHADLRDSFMGTPYSHACAMRRVLEYARCTQVGIRSLSTEDGGHGRPRCDHHLYDFNMRGTRSGSTAIDSLAENISRSIVTRSIRRDASRWERARTGRPEGTRRRARGA
jgi:agmatinase